MEVKWQDLLNVFLWNRYGGEFVQDDTAYVALLRLRQFVETALLALETPVPVKGDEQ